MPDKDNLQHGFAARYSIPESGIVSGGLEPTNCEVLYFGSDRFDNSGDAQQGFWFFQNQITLDQRLGGGQNFIGVHENGDLLIISDFSNGGTKSRRSASTAGIPPARQPITDGGARTPT